MTLADRALALLAALEPAFAAYSQGLAHLRELVGVNELATAMEDLSDHLLELGQPFTQPQLDAYRQICEALKLPESRWRSLERLLHT